MGMRRGNGYRTYRGVSGSASGRAVRRPYVPTRRRTSSVVWWRNRNARIVLGALGLVGALVVVMFLLGDSPPTNTHLVWIAEKSTAAPAGIPQALRGRVDQVAAAGEGTLDVYVVGQQYRRVGSVDLSVKVNDELVTDPKRLKPVLDERLSLLEEQLNKTTVSNVGFSLYSMLQATADVSAEEQPDEIWMSTVLLSATETPMAMSQLTATDPTPASQAVLGSVAGHLGLKGVELHSILLTPVGAKQRPLSPEQEQWRASFIAALCHGLGVAGSPPKHDGSTSSPWRGSSRVPAVAVPVPRKETPPRATDRTVKLDTVSFMPDTADLLDAQAASHSLAGLVKRYARERLDWTFRVDGYCAAFGPQESARELSAARARTIAQLLKGAHVRPADVEIHGYGYDRRAEPSQPSTSPGQRVVVVTLLPRSGT